MVKKILVVDDEKDMVAVLSQRLKGAGYEVTSASDGEEALKAVKKERFDLILLDIIMPVMDGTQFAQILRENPKTKNIPILFITALATKQKDAGYVITESNIIFAKPFESKELLGKIDELVNELRD